MHAHAKTRCTLVYTHVHPCARLYCRAVLCCCSGEVGCAVGQRGFVAKVADAGLLQALDQANRTSNPYGEDRTACKHTSKMPHTSTASEPALCSPIGILTHVTYNT